MVDETAPVVDDGSETEKTDEEIWNGLKEGEAAPEEEATPSEPAATEEEAPAEEAPDPWAAVPEDLRAERQTLQDERDAAVDHAKRISGGIPAQNRKINELMTRNAQLEEAAKAPAESSSQEEPAEPEDLVQAREEYPEVTAPLESKIDQGNAELRADIDKIQESQAKTDARFSEIDATTQETNVADQIALIDDKHSDWREVRASDAFKTWGNAQSTMTRQAIANSNDAGDVISVLDRFKADAGTEQKPTATTVKREAQKASAETPRPGGTPVIATEGQPEDDEAIWEKLRKDDERQSAAGR